MNKINATEDFTVEVAGSDNSKNHDALNRLRQFVRGLHLEDVEKIEITFHEDYRL